MGYSWTLASIRTKPPSICDMKFHGISMRIHVTFLRGTLNVFYLNQLQNITMKFAAKCITTATLCLDYLEFQISTLNPRLRKSHRFGRKITWRNLKPWDVKCHLYITDSLNVVMKEMSLSLCKLLNVFLIH